ncbi:class I SAM-dependent methyltransferase [Paenibacillus sambharensis]|uniref:Class I SAM-dependent methyltransferase n=1 Tax=Paenibacillus sambharensis TaxID=1803190 RepID=A0A2W1LNU6_9BACL|nr:class I SAM-dependent methyltransferase [Paenibacillus sambharensis]PZD93087.1 class I SAM-dependent methyltransferase [Paenibacillus sambharensis]
MEKYEKHFAAVYNTYFANFSDSIFERIAACFKRQPIHDTNAAILDLCCGTGQLSLHFLNQGYKVTGIDLSEHMLSYAVHKAKDYIKTGVACFMVGDATRFELDERFGMVVSTYDALNHLEHDDALVQCFRSVCRALEQRGIFIFDLNTRSGLMHSDGMTINEDNHKLLITKRQYHSYFDKGSTRYSGFMRMKGSEEYFRFDQTVYNTTFDLLKVKQYLQNEGFVNVRFTSVEDLTVPLVDPEAHYRVFVIAERA